MSLKKLLFFAVILASIVIVNNFVHSIYNLWQKNHLITKAKQELAKESKENKMLKDRLGEVTKPDFVEKEARDKLFLGKPEEKLVILPTDYLSASGSAKKDQDKRPNWQKWWEIFFTTSQ